MATNLATIKFMDDLYSHSVLRPYSKQYQTKLKTKRQNLNKTELKPNK